MLNISKEILEKWDLEELPPEKQAEMIESIGRMLYQAILVRSLDVLSEKEQTELDSLLDIDSTVPEDILTFLKSRIPTFDSLLSEEKQKLKEDIMVS